MKSNLFIFSAFIAILSISCNKKTSHTVTNKPEKPIAAPPRNTIPQSLNGTRIFNAWRSVGTLSPWDSTTSNKTPIEDVAIEFNVLSDTTLTVTIKFKDSTIKDELILNREFSVLRYPGSNYHRSIDPTIQTKVFTEFYSDTLANNIPLLVRSYLGNNTTDDWHFEFNQK